MMSISKLLLISAILISLPAIPLSIDTTSTAEAHVDSDRGSRGPGSVGFAPSHESRWHA